LLFEDTHTGRGAPVAGSDLAAQLDRLPRGHRPVLVVLAACRSARAAESAESLSSAAAMLHTVGVERVLGMRLSVLDGAASAFDAELFRRLALGDDVGRAVTLARQAVVQDSWWQPLPGQDRSRGDPWAQWSLPVLLDRTQDGPLVDMDSTATPLLPRPNPTVLIGDGTVHLPERQAFIGRRKEKRQYLRAFLEGETRGLLFMGPGGVGKTTLAGLFARAFGECSPNARLLGFRAPFVLDMLYEPLRREAFDGTEEPSLLAAIQAEPDLHERMRRLLQSLAQRRDRPCVVVLDNLEAIQDLASLEVAAEHADSLWFLREVCVLPAPTRVLLTGRYTIGDLPDGVVRQCPVPDAPFGDVLRRMQRLVWPPTMSAADKHRIYSVLGGNHRAIEWAAQVLKQEHHQTAELVAVLSALHAPTDTPEQVAQVVIEAMRQNLLFTRLRSLLTSTQDRLLRAASLYRVPVNEDGLLALTTQPAQFVEDRQRLANYSLLEWARDPELALDYWLVVPVVRELLHDHGFASSEVQALHRSMGRYYRFQGQYVSRRWSDDVEAIYHFRQARDHTAADEIADEVCDFYYRISNYADARVLTEDIVNRASPPPPWWAVNRYGLCQLALGFYDSARAAFKSALPITPTQEEKGTTLNNLSQIYDARGDYDTALRYLEASLAIRREIGDKAGEGTTLNNLSSLAYARGDYDTALRYLEASLAIRREIGDKAGLMTTLHNMGHIAWEAQSVERALTLWMEAHTLARETQNAQGLFHTASTLGLVLAQGGAESEARPFLQLAVEVGKVAGFADVEEVETVLRRLSSDEP
jgi:tetratricopeptide (TPR) repeat protein